MRVWTAVRVRRGARAGLRLVIATAVASGVVLAAAPAASAHPLGNFTTNTAATVTVAPDAIGVDYAIDTAEIPTLREKTDVDADGDGTFSSVELASYAAGRCADVAGRVGVRVDGTQVALRSAGGTAALVDGAAGLQTLRVECPLSASADLTNGRHDVEVSNDWVGDRIGWHEITAVGDGMSIDGDVASSSPSDGLRSYPQDLLASPPDVRSATFTTTPGGARAEDAVTAAGGRRIDPGTISAIPAVDRASQSFTDLVSREQLTFGVALLGLVLAILLGSLHALAPGHGKTVMAAYLLGGEGTGRQALALCATVTVTHTAGVLVLGTALTVTTVVAPERLYPVLGAISGLLVASIGASMLRRARRYRSAGFLVPQPDHHHDDHEHPHPHPHDDHEHDHSHPHDDHEHDHAHGGHHVHGVLGHSHPDPSEPVSWKSLIGMGFAGGMVPSPSALLVLLGAIALGRTWFGVALVVAYGAGMAISLVAAGLLLLRLRNRIDRYLSTRNGRRMSERLVIMPSLTAALVVIGGIYIAVRAGLQY